MQSRPKLDLLFGSRDDGEPISCASSTMSSDFTVSCSHPRKSNAAHVATQDCSQAGEKDLISKPGAR